MNQIAGVEHGPRRRNLNDVNSLLKDGPRLNSADVASRAAYLKEQRDKLLALKMKERQKQINVGTYYYHLEVLKGEKVKDASN